MSGFANISRPSDFNVGGASRLVLVDVDDIENTTIRTVRNTGYVNQPINLKANKDWIEVSFTPRSLSFKETPSRSFGQTVFSSILSWKQAKDDPARNAQFQRMERKRFIALIQTNNLEWIIVGSPEEPAVFSLKSRDIGKTATDYNGYDVSLIIGRRVPVAFYRVYATFHWDDNGQLIFDNTFDPTLTASVSATGDLTIGGPNSSKYTEAAGYLIYTP